MTKFQFNWKAFDLNGIWFQIDKFCVVVQKNKNLNCKQKDEYDLEQKED